MPWAPSLAFEHETLVLLQRGDLAAALANVAISVIAGLTAVWAGSIAGRLL